MAKKVIKNAFFSLGGTDISGQLDSIEFQVQADEVEVTNFDSAGWQEVLQGIKKGSINLNFKADADLSGIHKTIWDAFVHATTNTLAYVLKQDDATVTTANPQFSGNVLVKDYMLNLQLGQAFGGQMSFPLSGAPTRATS